MTECLLLYYSWKKHTSKECWIRPMVHFLYWPMIRPMIQCYLYWLAKTFQDFRKKVLELDSQCQTLYLEPSHRKHLHCHQTTTPVLFCSILRDLFSWLASTPLIPVQSYCSPRASLGKSLFAKTTFFALFSFLCSTFHKMFYWGKYCYTLKL